MGNKITTISDLPKEVNIDGLFSLVWLSSIYTVSHDWQGSHRDCQITVASMGLMTIDAIRQPCHQALDVPDIHCPSPASDFKLSLLVINTTSIESYFALKNERERLMGEMG